MKRFFVLLTVAALMPLFGFSWAKNFEDAKHQAATQNKAVMLMLTQKGCGMCDYMKGITLKDAEVMEVIEARFIPVEVDINEGVVPLGFRAYGTPTFYFTDATGKRIGRQFAGGAKADAFVEILRKVGR